MAVSLAAKQLGPKLIHEVAEAMGVDEAWSVEADRRLIWWPGKQAQRIWAGEPVLDHGVEISPVHIETDLLQLKPGADELLALAGGRMAHLACLSAPIHDAKKGSLRLHATVWVHEQNFGTAVLLAKTAAALQVGEAYGMAEKLAKAIGCDVAVSAHPKAGVREEADAILGLAGQAFRPHAAKHGPGVDPAEFTKVAELVSNHWLATADSTGLTVEVPFSGDNPAIVSSTLGQSTEVETALVQADIHQEHPSLGAGLFMKLTLPVSLAEEEAFSTALAFNLAEAQGGTVGMPLLGAWCAAGTDLVFVLFCPSLSYRPNLLTYFVMNQGLRARWAHGQLKRD